MDCHLLLFLYEVIVMETPTLDVTAGVFVNKEEAAAAEAERMLEEREEELRRRLKGFEDGTTK